MTKIDAFRLVYSGCFDRHPGLRVITHHAAAQAIFAGNARRLLRIP